MVKVSSLTNSEKRTLGKSISNILLKALNDKGSSFDARYVLPSGDAWKRNDGTEYIKEKTNYVKIVRHQFKK